MSCSGWAALAIAVISTFQLMGKIYGENLWGKFMGKIYGENLWGKLMGKINGENLFMKRINDTFQHWQLIE
jgi:hypothetical protein